MTTLATLAIENKLRALLGKLQSVRQNGPNRWTALCPAHHDTTPSLSIAIVDNKILLYCHAGCKTEDILQAVGEDWAILFADEDSLKKHRAGLSLSELAAAKNLPIDFLESLGLRDSTKNGRNCVQIPYFDENGRELAIRYRHALNGHFRFTWRPGDNVCLYGLWRLDEIRKNRWVLLVEGESDSWTAWFYNIPALGIPGKGCWKSEWTSYFNGLAAYLWIEPDALDLVERVHKDISTLRVIRPPEGIKDLSELHLKGMDVLGELDNMLCNAQPAKAYFDEKAETKQKKTTIKTFPLTDLGNAERFVSRHGADLRFCHKWRTWLVWDGRRWRLDDTAAVMRKAKETIRALYAEAALKEDDHERRKLAEFALRGESRNRLAAMVELAASEEGIPILPADLDQDPWLLNVLNGTLDLHTGDLKPHRREDYITKLAPVVYDPHAQCPRWLQFLDEIMAGNTALVSFLQRAVGMTLTGDTSEHVLFILYGTGRNGKSTFLRTVQTLLGEDYAAQAVPELLLTKHGDRHPTELADLYGKRFVCCIETAEGRRLAENIVKWLTGNDRIKARRMREDFWEFSPTHKIWLATNHKPQIRGTDLAIWSRIKLIPFNVTIPEERQDLHLSQKLSAELPGILRWAVEGCLAWQRDGLGVPAEVKKATEDYRGEQDILAGFLNDCCCLAPTAKVPARLLYQAYTRWCEENGEPPLSQRELGTRLVERGLSRGKGTGGRYVWYGITLTDGTTNVD